MEVCFLVDWCSVQNLEWCSSFSMVPTSQPSIVGQKTSKNPTLMFAAELQIELLCVSFAPPIHQNRQPPKNLHQTLESLKFLEVKLQNSMPYQRVVVIFQKISCRRKPRKTIGGRKNPWHSKYRELDFSIEAWDQHKGFYVYPRSQADH